MSASPPPDNRFIRIRSAAQDATDFELGDDAVRRFVELRDQGADAEAIGRELNVDAEVVGELVAADESYATAHRIAEGELPMYPPPEPGQEVIDTRAGTAWVPVAVLVVVLGGVILYGLLR